MASIILTHVQILERSGSPALIWLSPDQCQTWSLASKLGSLPWCAVCSGLVGRAETAAAVEEHGEPAGDPDHQAPVEVVGDVPWHVDAPGGMQRSHAESVVLGEHKGGAGGEDSKLEDAHEESAVDGADSPSVSPGADEHEQGVQADETEQGAHEDADGGHLGALGLAVNVAIVDHLDVGIEEVLVKVLVPVIRTT